MAAVTGAALPSNGVIGRSTLKAWLKLNARTTLEEFRRFLRSTRDRPHMKHRFPGIRP
jgi:hypothetical protein